MNIDYFEDGILVIDEFAESSYCSSMINYFDKVNNYNLSYSRTKPKHLVDDISIDVLDKDVVEMTFVTQRMLTDKLLSNLWNTVDIYTEKYSVLKRTDLFLPTIKVQKTSIGQGYHVWHDDGGTAIPDISSRAIVFIVYLNDVIEGGETEFLYYPMRVKAKTGRILMFPANYMWAHRGNSPISNAKYIQTGWINYGGAHSLGYIHRSESPL